MTKDEAVKEARNNYAHNSDDDITIDDSPVVEETEGGFWVQAWVHVRKPDPEEEV